MKRIPVVFFLFIAITAFAQIFFPPSSSNTGGGGGGGTTNTYVILSDPITGIAYKLSVENGQLTLNPR